MRLRDWELDAIKRSAAESFGIEVVVRLFGSRIDDSRKGGDIDLHVSVPEGRWNPAADALFRRLLDRRIGEREIDIIWSEPGMAGGPVHDEALRTGILL